MWLTNLKEMLPTVPSEYESSVHLDLKALREDSTLAGAITPKPLGVKTPPLPVINQVPDGLGFGL